MNSSSSLSQIYNLASDLRKMVAKPPNEVAESPYRGNIPRLQLTRPPCDTLENDLASLGVTVACQQTLIGLYEERLAKLEHAYIEVFSGSISTLHRDGQHDPRFERSFERLLAGKFRAHAQKLWEMILEEVRRTVCVATMAEDTASCTFSTSFLEAVSSEPFSGKSTRGHDSDAVRILEQAFHHTLNITQAEKYRLAEVTGLKPKQVTIWFQNRRNRKGKTHPKPPLPTTPPPSLSPDLPCTPASHITRAFTLSEKKRKSYGALSHSSPPFPTTPSSSDSDRAKKSRTQRSTSGTSDSSASSTELSSSFTVWSSPSSRSTSSSSTQSSQSDGADSPSKQNVFRYSNPLRYEERVRQQMPSVTMEGAQQAVNGVAAQRSPFTADNVGSFGLGVDMRMWQKELQGAVREALAGGRGATMDDDAWVDEEESLPQGTNAVGFQQNLAPTPTAGSLQALINFHSQPQPTNPNSFYNSNDLDSFNLDTLFGSIPNPSSSPFVPHTHQSPQQPQNTPTNAGESGACLDFEIDMADIDDFLNITLGLTGGDGGVVEGEGAEAQQQWVMNFDSSDPSMFYST